MRRSVNDSRYVGVITECAIAVAAVMPKNRVRFIQRAGCVELVATSKSWPCFFPQHGPGPKHRRRIELTEWQADIVGDRARAKSVRLLDAFVGPKA